MRVSPGRTRGRTGSSARASAAPRSARDTAQSRWCPTPRCPLVSAPTSRPRSGGIPAGSVAAAILRLAVDAPRPRILYIAGAGRSGSTLLAMRLGGLPGCTAVGELRHIWERGVLGNRLCGCGEPFRECPFWSAVGQEAFGGWDAVDAERQAARLMRVGRQRHFPLVAAGAGSARFRAEHAAYGQLQARVYRAVAAVSQDAAIVDSSKSPVYALTPRAAGLDGDVP